MSPYASLRKGCIQIAMVAVLQTALADDSAIINAATDTLSFSAPAFAMDYPDGSNDGDVYLSFVRGSNSASNSWRGNVKRYQLNNDGIIVDMDGVPLIDGSTGYLRPLSKSDWFVLQYGGNASDEQDGGFVMKGGLLPHLQYPRDVYTNLSGERDVALTQDVEDVPRSSVCRISASGLPADPTTEQCFLKGTDPQQAFTDAENDCYWFRQAGIACWTEERKVMEPMNIVRSLHTNSNNNPFLTNKHLNIGSWERTSLINWALGLDENDEDGDGVTNDDRPTLGDPLHTQPIIFPLSETEKILLFTTNAGSLHIADANTGELFLTFQPRWLLRNWQIYKGEPSSIPAGFIPSTDDDCTLTPMDDVLGTCDYSNYCTTGPSTNIYAPQDRCVNFSSDPCIYYGGIGCEPSEFCELDQAVAQTCKRKTTQPSVNVTTSAYRKIYGLDGPMTLWHFDGNGDGRFHYQYTPVHSGLDHLYLYLTMRRGGSNLYALDISFPREPVLKWIIRGDRDANSYADAASLNPDFGQLGQTWSKPHITKVSFNSLTINALLFGGGYDKGIDTQPTTIAPNNIGVDVFIVNANDGSLLWRANPSNYSAMKYSFTADTVPIDSDGDGTMDLFYAIDMGGQLWRFDENPSASSLSDLFNGQVIAQLSSMSGSDARRFYQAPTVAINPDNTEYYIALGSGFRPMPYNLDVNDRIFVIKDLIAPGARTTIDETELYNATGNLIQDGNQSERSNAALELTSKKGWYINLEVAGEKLMTDITVADGRMMFNTFDAAGVVAGYMGTNRTYVISLWDGSALSDLNNTGALNKNNRSKVLQNPMAPSTPYITARLDGTVNSCTGIECTAITTPPPTPPTAPPPMPPLILRGYWQEL